jgi:hypothetical protein
MLLIKGASPLLKIWCGVTSDAGCVHLWFSIAITKTVLIGAALTPPQYMAKIETATTARGQTRNERSENKACTNSANLSWIEPDPIQTRDVTHGNNIYRFLSLST